ncbi:HigA family addiction module antitoxin [Desulfonatronovibrio magnus]|uniref:HigA family addiction module antitoxin n=1 Tax=Desulfonatronovibrio magnus TaxID=698827 RepID=UPI000A03A394|nr:HigA family addiction module antitoxin [Desulfonatronovibrio magnus]
MNYCPCRSLTNVAKHGKTVNLRTCPLSLLNERRRITSDTALRLSRYFGTSAEFWMNLQQAYDLKIARESTWSDIEVAVRPLCVNA